MKKMNKVFILVLIAIVFITGCEKKKEKEKEKDTSNWDTSEKEVNAVLSDEASEVFEKTGNTTLTPIALLGKQVVAGTNYMYLCQDDEDEYKVVIVYKDLEDKVTITNTSDFNVSRYANENITYKNNDSVGSWYTEIPTEKAKLSSKVEKIFNDAASKKEGIAYTPIALLGTQVVAGTNYALLAYGVADDANNNTGVYLLTLYEDLSGIDEIVSSAYIDLANFNK